MPRRTSSRRRRPLTCAVSWPPCRFASPPRISINIPFTQTHICTHTPNLTVTPGRKSARVCFFVFRFGFGVQKRVANDTGGARASCRVDAVLS